MSIDHILDILILRKY